MLTAPDYPFATAVPADTSNYRTASRRAYSVIIVHITDGRGDALPVAQMWQKPGHGSSAHFVIGQDGTMIQAVALKDVAWHSHDCNGVSVGVEHCARSPGEPPWPKDDPGLPLSEAQWEASAKLVAWLLTSAGLPCDRKHVLGHAEADAKTTHSDCPTGVAGGWDWDAYMARIAAQMEALAPRLDA